VFDEAPPRLPVTGSGTKGGVGYEGPPTDYTKILYEKTVSRTEDDIRTLVADNKYPGTYCGCPNGGDSEVQFPRFDAEKLERKEERDLSKLGDVLSWKVDVLELGYIVAC
jgi:hypothetical protein